LVKKGDRIKIEKIEREVGSKYSFPEVLFMGDEKEIKIGTPILKGVKVEAKILKQEKSDKVWGMKHKPKKRYKVKFGHRQPFTEVEITDVA